MLYNEEQLKESLKLIFSDEKSFELAVAIVKDMQPDLSKFWDTLKFHEKVILNSNAEEKDMIYLQVLFCFFGVFTDAAGPLLKDFLGLIKHVIENESDKI